MFPTNSQLNQLNQLTQFPTTSFNTLLFQGLKIVLLIITGIYIVFAFMMTRQINIMDNTLKTPLINPIRIVGYVHLIAAILLLVLILQYSP